MLLGICSPTHQASVARRNTVVLTCAHVFVDTVIKLSFGCSQLNAYVLWIN